MPQTVELSVPSLSTVELPVLGTNGSQVSSQLSSEQRQDLNDWYDAQEREWLQQQQYRHDNYLYDDRI